MLKPCRIVAFAIVQLCLGEAAFGDRLPVSDQAAAVKSGPYADLVKGEWIHQGEPLAEGGLPFWIYADKKLGRGKERFPLVIVLHGRRDKAKPGEVFHVQSLATAWAKDAVQRKNPCFVVQPYYPPKSGWEKIPEKLDASVRHWMGRLPVDTSRIYLVGFSNGGQGTFQALARQPDWFAAGLTISGPVLLKSIVGKINAPLWCWVGENDHDLNKRKRVEELVAALKADGHSIQLNVVPGAGHSCHGKATGSSEVIRWLFSQELAP